MISGNSGQKRETNLRRCPGKPMGNIRRARRTGKDMNTGYSVAVVGQINKPEGRDYVPDVLDDIDANLEIGFKMIFDAIPSFY